MREELKAQFHQLMLQDGFSLVNSNQPEVKAFIRVERTVICLVQVVDNWHPLDSFMWNNMTKSMEKSIADHTQLPVHHLSILTTNDVEEGRLALANDPFAWIIDERAQRLEIAEDKAQDFYGCRRKIEELLAGTLVLEPVDLHQLQRENQRQMSRSQVRQPANIPRRYLFRPIITILLVVLNVIVFMASEYQESLLVGGMISVVHLRLGEYYRLITSLFLHADVGHLAGNMMWLICAGILLERTLGPWKYALLYLLSGVAGNLLSCLYEWLARDFYLSLGASGAVFGLIGGLLWLYIRRDENVRSLSPFQITILLMFALYNGLANTPGVNNWAHLGGCVAGMILAMILYRKKRWN